MNKHFLRAVFTSKESFLLRLNLQNKAAEQGERGGDGNGSNDRLTKIALKGPEHRQLSVCILRSL